MELLSYFVSLDGQQKEGPFSYQELQARYNAGSYAPSALYWHKGMAGWLPLSSLMQGGFAPAVLIPQDPNYRGYTLWTATRECINKYATFRGRATQSEYWYFQLFQLICLILVSMLACGLVVFGIVLNTELYGKSSDDTWVIYSLTAAASLVLHTLLVFFIPNLAATCRRLHDMGQSGHWQWLNLIPYGNYVVLIMCAFDGQRGNNQYGPSEKYPDRTDAF